MSEDLKQKILAQVAGDLSAIETALSKNLDPFLDIVADIARHILFSGGKRLRPLLAVLSAGICGRRDPAVIGYATIFEYLHAATLLHDDLVDGARMRRGVPAAYRVWDNSTAVLVGDFLLARSLSIAADTGRPEVIRVIAQITENMSQGEIHQLMRKGAFDIDEAEYIEVIRRKTAVLFQGACRVGAMVCDAPPRRQAALADYGLNLGLAFQMADDLLDYTADSAVLGKLVGADLREGKLTLPVIHALEQAGSKEREEMVRIIRNPLFTEEQFKVLTGKLERLGGIDYTRGRAADLIAKARSALGVFEDGPSKQLLLDIAEYALVRTA
jgi:octaprenyl-diphosphate synthase